MLLCTNAKGCCGTSLALICLGVPSESFEQCSLLHNSCLGHITTESTIFRSIFRQMIKIDADGKNELFTV